jgi:Ca2+:H+ antiporter
MTGVEDGMFYNFFSCLINLQRQSDMNLLMLLMALMCHLLAMLFQYGGASVAFDADSSLQFSRAASIVMVIAYFAYLIFQLWTHRQLFEAQDVCFV